MCPQCCLLVEDKKQHIAEFHSQSNFFCKHKQHGDQIFFFRNEKGLVAHKRTFHAGKHISKDAKSSLLFPECSQKLEQLDIQNSSFSKRKLNHLK